jgi:hypothetical protein
MDPRAVEKLQRMSEVLAKAQTLSVEAESLYDQVELSIMKIVKIKRNWPAPTGWSGVNVSA